MARQIELKDGQIALILSDMEDNPDGIKIKVEDETDNSEGQSNLSCVMRGLCYILVNGQDTVVEAFYASIEPAETIIDVEVDEDDKSTVH